MAATRLAATFAKTLSWSDKMSMTVKVKADAIDTKALAKLILGKTIFPRLIVTGNDEGDVDGQETMDTDLEVGIVATCPGFSVTPEHYTFRLSIDSDGIAELGGVRGRKGFIQFGE